jgi:hypothetical protein
MRICFDLDETLCTGYPYEIAIPLDGACELLQKLGSEGHTIIIQTARGMGRSNGNIGKAQNLVAKLTLDQLESWGFIYDEIYFGKPAADLYIDDKSLPDIKTLQELLWSNERLATSYHA